MIRLPSAPTRATLPPMLALLTLLAAQAVAPAQTPPANAATAPAPAATRWPTREGDFTIPNFRFRDGATLPRLRLHYTTLGTPRRNARGEVENAVVVLHGTGGTGKQFLQPQFADELYGPGQPLDIRRHWIILPDSIGHGGSSKPSDGMRMRFPRYDYGDMVEAHHRLLTEGLGVKRARLVMGTSMGCMHILTWGQMYPDDARALMPLGCNPVEIAGLNRMWRQLAIDGVRADPAWAGGEYRAQPVAGLRTAASLLFVAGGAPLLLQRDHPTRDGAAAHARERVERQIAGLDANDLIYQIDASRTYDPWPGLHRITTPTVWINSADDFINPRGLDFAERAVRRMPDARFRLIPETPDTRGHGTHTWAKFWRDDLVGLLARTEPPR